MQILIGNSLSWKLFFNEFIPLVFYFIKISHKTQAKKKECSWLKYRFHNKSFILNAPLATVPEVHWEYVNDLLRNPYFNRVGLYHREAASLQDFFHLSDTLSCIILKIGLKICLSTYIGIFNLVRVGQNWQKPYC